MSEKTGADRVRETITAAESLLGIAVTIHDRSGIFRDRQGRYLLNHTRGIHRHPCCRLIHDHRCLAECRDYIDPECDIRDRPFSHVCWKGLKEVVVPVKREGSLLFILFAGGYKVQKKTGAVPDPRLKKNWLKLFSALPVMTARREKELGLALAALGNGLVQLVDELNFPARELGGRRGDIRRFLHYNAHRKVTVTDLARALHLSRFRTSHLVTELFGVPFRTLLLGERVKRARSLLLSNPDRTVANIAEIAGIGDEYHFNRVFKSKYGLPPGQYRKRYRPAG
jgi:AraC family transcriptional regulator